MDIRIAGGHGSIARILTRQLTADGHSVTGFIRSRDQEDDLRADGATPVLLDLETAELVAVTDAVRGADAVLFAAGAGPGSGPERKWSVDHGAAVSLLEAAKAADVRRYVIISSMGAGDPPAETDDEDVFAVYLRAKAAADEAVQASDRDWTIVRPGALTDDDPAGQVAIAESLDRDEVPRADVAAVLAAVLTDERTVGRILTVTRGDRSIEAALDAAVS